MSPSAVKRDLTASLSTFLDLLRLAAAMAVFFEHAHGFFLPSIPGPLASNGMAGVAVFFVLSGFLIRHATTKRQQDWQSYGKARLARLYSVLPLALVVTAFADALGRWFSPQRYTAFFINQSTGPLDWLTSLTLTNELWFTHHYIGSDEPIWSLGFEAWYYVFFGAVLFSRGVWRWLFAALWFAVAGPKITLFLGLWLLGVAIYDLLHRTRFVAPRWAGAVLLVAAYLGYNLLTTLSPGWGVQNMFWITKASAVGPALAYFSSVGILVAALIIGFALLFPSGRGSIWPEGFSRAIKWAAGASFTLYLVHQPLLLLLSAAFPDAGKNPFTGTLVLIEVLALVCLLAEVGERKLAFYRKMLDGHLPGAAKSQAA